MTFLRSFRAAMLVTVAMTMAGTATAAEQIAVGSATGLPVPRFVSLKSDRVTVRAGPTKDQDVRWVFTRSALPVEVTAEFENWRRIRDREGAEGWVYHSLLSGRRTVLVEPRTKSEDELLPLHGGASEASPVIARLQPGVMGSVKRCSGSWCRIAGTGFDGWIEQDKLWGVYPEEKVE